MEILDSIKPFNAKRRFKEILISSLNEELVNDEPAFRQGLNDFIDGLEKAGIIYTFDNGETYYRVDDIRRQLDDDDLENPDLNDFVERFM